MPWLVAQTQSQREHIAKFHLERAGYQAYLPRIRKRTNRKPRISPLFPAYIFIFLNGAWGSVMRTIAITRVIRNGDTPAQLEDAVIDEIRGREKDGFVQLPKSPPLGAKGQKVRILRGPFAGHIGALGEAMTDSERQKVLLDFLGRKTAVEISRADVSLDIKESASRPCRS